MSHLDLNTLEELQELLLEALYQNIVAGRLDDQKKRLLVFGVMGRDVEMKQIPNLKSSMQNFQEKCLLAKDTLVNEMNILEQKLSQKREERVKTEQQVTAMMNNIKSSRSIMTPKSRLQRKE
jgi:COP9 signalosome complex subunit 7